MEREGVAIVSGNMAGAGPITPSHFAHQECWELFGRRMDVEPIQIVHYTDAV